MLFFVCSRQTQVRRVHGCGRRRPLVYGCQEQARGEEQVLRLDRPRPALEDDRAGAEGLLRALWGGPHGPSQERRQVGPVQRIRIHPLLQLRVSDESSGPEAHD